MMAGVARATGVQSASTVHPSAAPGTSLKPARLVSIVDLQNAPMVTQMSVLSVPPMVVHISVYMTEKPSQTVVVDNAPIVFSRAICVA